MAGLRARFSRRQWKGCCGKGCKKCEMARAYIGAYGRKEGLERLNEDRAVMQAKKKGGKKKGKTKGAKAKGGKKAKR